MIPFGTRLATLLGFALSLIALLAAGPAASTPSEGPAPAEPWLALDGDTLLATGLTPAGEAVVFGVARRPLGYHQRVERVEEVILADAAGEVRLVLEEGLPPFGVWAVVDTSTGAIATAPTPGFPLVAAPFPTAGLHGGGGGVPARMLQALEAAHVLYVRPGEGAWGIALVEGGAYDADGADDGILELVFAQMVPVGPSPVAAPTESLPGDVLVVVDPTDLSLFTLRVTPDVLVR